MYTRSFHFYLKVIGMAQMVKNFFVDLKDTVLL